MKTRKLSKMSNMTKVSKGKKGVIYSVVALMLSAAVYLNWSYTSVPNDELVSNAKHYGDTKLVDSIEDNETTVSSVESSLEHARLTKTKTRDEAINILNETINNANTTVDAKNDASEAMSVISKDTQAEGVIESLILAKGYDDSVVFINSNGVNVLVEKATSEFTASDAAIIKDIVLTETSVSADKIKIVESN